MSSVSDAMANIHQLCLSAAHYSFHFSTPFPSSKLCMWVCATCVTAWCGLRSLLCKWEWEGVDRWSVSVCVRGRGGDQTPFTQWFVSSGLYGWPGDGCFSAAPHQRIKQHNRIAYRMSLRQQTGRLNCLVVGKKHVVACSVVKWTSEWVNHNYQRGEESWERAGSSRWARATARGLERHVFLLLSAFSLFTFFWFSLTLNWQVTFLSRSIHLF